MSEVGIIPARAGFTFGLSERKGDLEDHPRACGVYQLHDTVFHHGKGSSPRVRGLLRKIALSDYPIWIIPARAGFTQSCEISVG